MPPLCKGERVCYADSPCGASAYARTEKSPYQGRFRARWQHSSLVLPRQWRGASRDGRVVKACRRQAQQPSCLARSAPSHASRPCAWSAILRAYAKLPAHACAHTTPWCCASHSPLAQGGLFLPPLTLVLRGDVQRTGGMTAPEGFLSSRCALLLRLAYIEPLALVRHGYGILLQAGIPCACRACAAPRRAE